MTGDHPSPSVGSRGASVLAWALATVVLLAIAWHYVPFVADDALISYRYSERLLGGQGLTYTDGERVEGYSNLLWVLLVAVGGLFTSDLILVGRILGSICGAIALAAVVRAAPIASWRTAPPTIAGLAALALSGSLAIWAIGGLEQALQSALLACALALVIRDGPSTAAWVPAIPLALLVLTRPDGALFTALVVVALVVTEGVSASTLRRVSLLAVIPALAWFAQLAFRLSYYGEWLPNTAYVKLSASTHHAWGGVHYLAGALTTHAPIVALALIGVVFVRPMRRRDVLVPLVVALGWSAYVTAIGGDIFPGRRHFLPTLVCLAFLVMATWRAWVGRWAWALQAAVLIVACGGYFALQWTDTENDRARTERWEWDGAVLATTLHDAFKTARPLVAADAVGCIGYFGKLPTLDMLGLNDHHIARSRPPGSGAGYIGHDRGDGRYVFSRRPDIVIFCSAMGGTGGCFPSGAEMSAMPEFKAEYRLITIVNPRLFGKMYVFVRTESPRIGIMRSDREIRIPGFLFASANTIARPAADGRLVAFLTTNDVFSLEGIVPPDETWHARAIASAPVEASVDRGTVRVTSGLEQSELREVVLTREAPRLTAEAAPTHD